MDPAQNASLTLADRTGDALAAMEHDVAVAAGPALVAAANTAAAALADVGLAAELTRQTRVATAPLGLSPDPVALDQDRLRTDIRRILGEQDDPAGELLQLGRTEPLLTMATAVQRGLAARRVPGWTRGVDADPCPLCVAWNDGKVRPTTVRMARHRGCACIQVPVLT